MKANKKEQVLLSVEGLEERIAPGVICDGGDCCEGDCDEKTHGNNGYGNGGEDGVPGNSANNNAPNAGEKAADIVR
jgi:hypothetical protein